MSTRMILSEKEREWLLEFHRKTAAILQSKIAELEKELGESQSRIIELSGTRPEGLKISGTAGLFPEYDTLWALWKKAEFVLKQQGKLSNTRDIAEGIFTLEPALDFAENRDKVLGTWIKNLGATLKQKVDKEEVFIRLETETDIFYGLEEWLEKVPGTTHRRIPRERYAEQE